MSGNFWLWLWVLTATVYSQVSLLFDCLPRDCHQIPNKSRVIIVWKKGVEELYHGLSVRSMAGFLQCPTRSLCKKKNKTCLTNLVSARSVWFILLGLVFGWMLQQRQNLAGIN